MGKTLVIIPARGGSKGIPRKNVRLINDKPLISHVIETLKQIESTACMDIYVSSDDDEILSVSDYYGAKTLKRPIELSSDEVPLDPVIHHAVNYIEKLEAVQYDYVITVQPTSPLLSSTTLLNAINQMKDDNRFDTLISVVDDRYLSWKKKDNGEIIPNYEERVNRQYLDPIYKETGAFLITDRKNITPNSRLGKNINVYEVPINESIDIDTEHDWWIVDKELRKKTILFRVDGYREIGLGHIYRCLHLAYNLIDHNILFVLNEKSDIGLEKIKNSFFNYKVIKNNADIVKIARDYHIDIVVNDILDTSVEYMKNLKNIDAKIVNFEDIGEGSSLADVIINDLYDVSENPPKNSYWGQDYYCLRDEFIYIEPHDFREKIKNVLVMFGGTDPSNLTVKTLKALNEMDAFKDVEVNVILGLGYHNFEEIEEFKKFENINIFTNVKSVASIMKDADLAISSQGRTIYELAAMNVPTIIMAQNERELTHGFGFLNNGFINLGLGEDVSLNHLVNTLNWISESNIVRKHIYNIMVKKDFSNGTNNVINLITN